ncbi:hypothetical protein [Ruminiclostridium cellulolyticum]|uniref:Uncharacterized protein n=1 Tax=Ruminiclostridium cellulolyticum (strain ATCC 35319 / DSM 5812 / JCM 6584 / H10) TaxID=394503 RepID=B8I7L1_RUMCH|nr:hypothetical protein [Ruminiclostridium cellulolyticum]ACL77082.1 conserved hypothetical protein [Ruminiclostridium cellulolyticum H10]
MTERISFTQEDCSETGYAMSIAGRVIVLKQSSLPEKCQNSSHQLYFCSGGNGSNSNPIGRSVFTVSLADGERIRWNRSDVLGILKPHLLPDSARLHLSQIRPFGVVDQREAEPKYSGYSFLPDGRYSAGVWLADEKEAMEYIEMQKDYQHRVMICDRNDFCVFEMLKGKVIYPSQEVIDKFLLGQQDGGMNIKL